MNDKDESCDALIPGADSEGGWGLQDLTPSGKYVRRSLVDTPGDAGYHPKDPEDDDLDFDESGCTLVKVGIFHFLACVLHFGAALSI